MNYDYKNLSTFGSDGGDIEFNCNKIQKDGIPEKWEPFKTADEPVLIHNSYLDKMRGMSYGYFANRGEIVSEKGKESREEMYKLGLNWVCLTVVNYQETYHSTKIYADHLRTPSDHDIEEFVRDAHSRGVAVCLKPMVHSEDNVWRAHIGFPDLNMDDFNAYWQPWFESYKNFILHYAELAQRLGVEMLCIGCEMLGTEHRIYDWKYIIQEIKRVYRGALVYNTNHDHEEDQEWFNELDFLGTSAYYPVGVNGTDYKSMVKEWEKVRERLDTIAEKNGKRFIFMEIGCRSVRDASKHPWDFTENLPYNESEQLTFYKSCMDVFYDDPHFAGVFWWDWPTTLPNTINKDFYIYEKETEKYLKSFYKLNS